MGSGRFSWAKKQPDGTIAFANRQRATSGASEKSASLPNLTNGSVRDALNEKGSLDLPTGLRGPAVSPPAATGRNPSVMAIEKALAEDRAAQRVVRTIPAWVRDADEDDLEWGQASGLLSSPGTVAVAQHNHTPSMRPGRAYDHARTNEPYIHSDASQHTSRWVTFAKVSAYPREPDETEKVSDEWLNRNFGDYSTPWLAGLEDGDGDDGSSRYHAFQEKRKVWYERTQDTILKNPLIPLVFRLTVFIFSAVALSLGATIHHYSDKNHFSQGPSAEMAIIVDAIAMVYTVYITVDEYISKPLGLRSIRAKLRLIFLDLFFIVFQAANLSLAFESLSDSGETCVADPSSTRPVETRTSPTICARQKALASVLMIALIAWLLTFAVSVLRLVERVAPR